MSDQAEVNRVQLIMEMAMRRRFAERKKEKKHERPTIEELERMLNDETKRDIDILPDGSICTVEEQQVYISDLVTAAIGALYEDGFKIVEQEREVKNG